MTDPRSLTASQVQAAAGVTSDELSQWYRGGRLLIPPIDPRPGKARRYGWTNLVEIALLKACVTRGVPHAFASRMFQERAAKSCALDGHPNPEIDRSSVLKLTETEFNIKKFGTYSTVYWIFYPSVDGYESYSTYDALTYLRNISPGKTRKDYNTLCSIIVVDSISAGATVIDTHRVVEVAFASLAGESTEKVVHERRAGYIAERTNQLDGAAKDFMEAYSDAIAESETGLPVKVGRYL